MSRQELAEAVPVLGCPSNRDSDPGLAEYQSGIGFGWDGHGTNSATLTWSANRLHPSLDPIMVRAVIAKALATKRKIKRGDKIIQMPVSEILAERLVQAMTTGSVRDMALMIGTTPKSPRFFNSFR